MNFQNGSHTGYPIGTFLAIFYLQVTLIPPVKFPVNWLFCSGEVQIDVQDGGCGGLLAFPIGTILLIFHLQVTLVLPTMFRVDLPFISGEEVQNRF